MTQQLEFNKNFMKSVKADKEEKEEEQAQQQSLPLFIFIKLVLAW
jgi:hypothetical protein